MAHYDQDTQKFMEDVSSPEKPQVDTRKALSLANAIVTGKSIPTIVTKEVTKALLNKQAQASVLDLYELLNSKFERRWMDWEPETLRTMLVGVIDVTQENLERVLALQVAVNTNYPFEHWHVFEKVGHAFFANHIDFDEIQPMEIDEAAATAQILQAIRPKQAFDEEVIGYIAACAHHAGLALMPTPLFPSGCQSALEHLVGPHFSRGLAHLASQYLGQTSDQMPSLAIQVQCEKIKAVQETVERELKHAVA